MLIHQDFTSRKISLVFDSGKKVDLTKEESEEFEKWFMEKKAEKGD